MSINLVYKDFPKICRLCLTNENLQPLLELKEIELFNTIIDIKLLEDKMPENVCLICVQFLKKMTDFIQMCKTNENVLKHILELEKSNIDSDSDVFDNDDIKVESAEIDDNKYTVKVKQELVELDADMVRHLNNHKKCENCGKTFNNISGLKEHYKEFVECHPKKKDTSADLCNIVDFLKKSRTKKKVKVKEESEEEPEFVNGKRLKGKRRFLCNHCGKNYTRKNGLERHMLSHSGIKPFQCRECGKSYITKDTLKTHLLTHTGIKAHKCTVCGKSFTQSSHLSYHMRRHAGEKPHLCTFCGKAFLSSYHLDRHILMHTGVKPYECNLCGKQFVRSTTLRDHMLIHTGEKPFQCQHCGKQFNRKQSLTNHVLVHSNGKEHTSKSIISQSNSIVKFGDLAVNNLLTDVPTFLNSSLENKNENTPFLLAKSLDSSVSSDRSTILDSTIPLLLTKESADLIQKNI